MIQPIYLPMLGETMVEATVEKWHKAEGDSVKKGEVLLEITTDKATLEVESSATGTVRKILAPEKVTLPVNTVIALIGEAKDPLPDNLNELLAVARGEKKTSAQPAAAQAETAAAESTEQAEAQVAAAPSGRILISPRARKVAEHEKVPLGILRGSGPGGRIVEKDVLAHLSKRENMAITPTAIAVAFERGMDVTSVKGTGPGGKVTKEDVLSAKPPMVAKGIGGKRIELSAMRRVVAERMTKSKREAPHFYLMMDIDMTAAAALRSKLNASGSVRIGFHDIIIHACTQAMKEHPAMNVRFADNALIQREEINIGLAVAIEEGLMVPVVHNADNLNLTEVAAETKRLIEKARSKRLTPDEYEGGCLTISNLGMYDVDSFLPVINPGESAILGVGRIAEKPVVVEGKTVARSMMSCTLSADHRAVDGAIAAAFLKRVKELLQNPS